MSPLFVLRSTLTDFRSLIGIIAIGVLVAFSSTPMVRAQSPEAQQASFKSPAEAIDALLKAAESESDEELLNVLGPDADPVIRSGDEVADRAVRKRFIEAYREMHKLEDSGENIKTLIIGSNEYPFPIPLVSDNGVWSFDTEAGIDEILARQIGENENAVIRVMQAYVVAQEEYAAADRDGKGPQFARRIVSTEGQKDGLYWPTDDGEEPSPLGPLVAEAKAEGYGQGNGENDGTTPYHGYLFKELLQQGKSAKGGAREFIVSNRMFGGYALVAAPSEYGNSGIMTFIVNHDGVVYEKDLGDETAQFVSKMTTFDPDETWTVVQDN